MSAVIITPAYAHTHRGLDRAIQRSGLRWLPLYEHSDLVRVRSVLLTQACASGADRIILADADTVPSDGALEALASSPDITPERGIWGLYPLRDGRRWNVEPEDAEQAVVAIGAGACFRIHHGGLGLCAIHRESLERAAANLPRVTEQTGLSWSPYCLPFIRGADYFPEDRALCARLVESGTALWCNPRVRAGHVVPVMLTEARG